MGWQDAERPSGPSLVARRQIGLADALPVAKGVVAVGGAVLYGRVWVGYEEFYDGLDLTPEDVGLGQATIVARAAVLLGVLSCGLAFSIGFGVVAFRLSAPVLATRPGSEPWFRYWGKVLGANGLALLVAVVVPVVVLRLAARGPSAPVLTSFIISMGGVALEVGWLLNDPELAIGSRVRRAFGTLYDGRVPRVGTVGWASNFLGDAAEAGEVLRSTGVLPVNKVTYLNVNVAPAIVHPKKEDPLRVCEGEAKALLLRRHGDVAFVLLVGGQSGEVVSRVLRLEEGDYGVVAVKEADRPCSQEEP